MRLTHEQSRLPGSDVLEISLPRRWRAWRRGGRVSAARACNLLPVIFAPRLASSRGWRAAETILLVMPDERLVKLPALLPRSTRSGSRRSIIGEADAAIAISSCIGAFFQSFSMAAAKSTAVAAISIIAKAASRRNVVGELHSIESVLISK